LLLIVLNVDKGKAKKDKGRLRTAYSLTVTTPIMPERPSEVITKRLHVSGLTAALSSHDLERRLAAFGSVTALDGFGKLDALGQPRKFAHVTLETTKPQLSRCMREP
jgi:hypothetical protein